MKRQRVELHENVATAAWHQQNAASASFPDNPWEICLTSTHPHPPLRLMNDAAAVQIIIAICIMWVVGIVRPWPPQKTPRASPSFYEAD